MLNNNYTASENLQKEDESLEIVEFIKTMLNSIDISSQSKIFTSLDALESSTIK